MIQQKLVNEISLNFPELFFTGKYVNIRFKNRVSPCYFLSYRDQKSEILQILNKRDCFTYILGFIFMAFLVQKLIYTVTI